MIQINHLHNSYNPYNLAPTARIYTDSFGKWIDADIIRENYLVVLNLFQDLKRFRNKFGMTDTMSENLVNLCKS